MEIIVLGFIPKLRIGEVSKKHYTLCKRLKKVGENKNEKIYKLD